MGVREGGIGFGDGDGGVGFFVKAVGKGDRAAVTAAGGFNGCGEGARAGFSGGFREAV